MRVPIKTYQTNRFVEKWGYVGLEFSMLVWLSLIISPFLAKPLLNQTITADVGEPVKLKDLTLKPQWFGALRVDVVASIPDNHWVTYEIQIFDKQRKLIGSAIKEAWKESGSWSEEGESGTWLEEDLQGGLDIRFKKNEQITLVLNVLGYGTGSTDIDSPVSFQVKIENGAIDTRNLWTGGFGSLVLGLMALMAVPQIGKTAIQNTINDSDLSERGTVGGSAKLVRMNVYVKSDETSPRQLQVKLFINNSYGEQIYSTVETMLLNFKKDEDSHIQGASGSLQKFFLIDTEDNYGFLVEIFPDAPVDRTTLKVKNGVRTRTSVQVTHIYYDSLD